MFRVLVRDTETDEIVRVLETGTESECEETKEQVEMRLDHDNHYITVEPVEN